MKKIVLMIVVFAMLQSAATALAAHPARDWSRYMSFPTGEQLSRTGTSRSPYIAFFPRFSRQAGMTAFAMDFRIDHDPDNTYICPAV